MSCLPLLKATKDYYFRINLLNEKTLERTFNVLFYLQLFTAKSKFYNIKLILC
jgi:hypothetical protein